MNCSSLNSDRSLAQPDRQASLGRRGPHHPYFSAGIPSNPFGCIDIRTRPNDNVGLQDHERVLKADVTQSPK